MEGRNVQHTNIYNNDKKDTNNIIVTLQNEWKTFLI